MFSERKLRCVLKFLFLLGMMDLGYVFADAKHVLVSLPVLTLGREGALRAELNFFERGTLALEWSEWVGKGQREELTIQEMKDNSGTSLRTEGRDLGMMFGNYTDPHNMGGFNWGLGLGYRTMKLNWTKISANNSDLPQGEKSHFAADAYGPTVSARVGYRFVGENVGFAIGTFLGAKHFLSQISDRSDENGANFSTLGATDKVTLKKKLATSLKIGIEIGWAF